MEIRHHPRWQKISPFKKPLHLARIFLATQYAKTRSRSSFIGVTGSVGKTTTVTAISKVLATKYETIFANPNLDPILNIPITLTKLKPATKKIVLELSIEYPGEMELYLSWVKPAAAVVTRIYYAKSVFLGSLEQIAEEQGKLVESLPEDGSAYLNWDDPIVKKLATKTKAAVVYYGFNEENCHVWASKQRIENFSSIFELNYGVERVEIVSSLLGFHNIYSFLAAAAIGLNEGISLTTIKKALESITPVEHRLQVIEGHADSIIIDDSCDSSPVAVKEALNTLNQLPARRRIVVLGEMKELGRYSEKLHRDIAQNIFKDRFDFCLLGTGDAKLIGEELLNLGFHPERLQIGLQNPQIVSSLLKLVGKGDVVLIKGAKESRLDEVVRKVSKNK